ncbi:MAG: DNA repair protein RadA [Rhodobiaceae bacterium]|nr:DNA repair protein RadA [Rhodobiaceae bacterium]MCC0041708.1 DNA repair protein RadA [Rhodobiaceae bacterium]
MARATSKFVCQNCGATHIRWSGRCDACGEWNTLVEEDVASAPVGGAQRKARAGRPIALAALSGAEDQPPRISTAIAELDRVAGGGLVRGSALLVGGDPGIGKSTLLLQAAAKMAVAGNRVVYVSGEEAIDQVRLRAVRLGVHKADVGLAAETNVENILATLEAGPSADLVVIDSIQTLWTDSIESAPGTVSQVRASAQMLIRHAKRTGACVVLVGHVTKDGQIAGPRVVEHMVDAVLYFEGDGAHQFRLLRAVKNRFGPTDEIGVFEMTGQGLGEVANPSSLFLGERDARAPGAAVFAGMEGTRPLLVEIQALVAPSTLATPRRAVVGWDSARLSMILAVLDAHCGLKLGAQDVYLNVAGGLRIVEPAADLAVAAALVSSMARVPLPVDTVYFGEISLSGAVRPVGHEPQRLKEAAKLGFSRAVTPSRMSGGDAVKGVEGIESLAGLVAMIAARAPEEARKP